MSEVNQLIDYAGDEFAHPNFLQHVGVASGLPDHAGGMEGDGTARIVSYVDAKGLLAQRTELHSPDHALILLLPDVSRYMAVNLP